MANSSQGLYPHRVHSWQNQRSSYRFSRLKGMKSVETVTGPYDVIAIVELDTLNEIGDLVTQHIHPITGITRTVTCLVV